jgi:hypothetical protein
VTPAKRLAALLLASAAVQVALCRLPDTMGDLLSYRLWAQALARDGLAAAYWPDPGVAGSAQHLETPVDYPPLVPYVLLAIGRLCGSLSCRDQTLEFLIRLPFVAANLGIGVLLFVNARRAVGPAHSALAVTAAAAYLFSPGVLFDTVYWGQADSLCALFLVGSVVALGRDRPGWAWACLALATLTKPLAYPYLPLVMLVTIKRLGWRAALLGSGVFCSLFAAALLPFAWLGRLGSLLHALFFQLAAMPYASVNAHNLWWLIQGGTPWLEADARPFGFGSCEALGLVLFAAFYAATLIRLWRSVEERSTAPFAGGPQLRLPQQLPLDPHAYDYYLAHGYTYLVEELRGDTSLWGVLLTLLNSQTIVLAFCCWLWCFHGREGFDAALSPRQRPPISRLLILAMGVFVLATGYPFVSRALREGRSGEAEKDRVRSVTQSAIS